MFINEPKEKKNKTIENENPELLNHDVNKIWDELLNSPESDELIIGLIEEAKECVKRGEYNRNDW